jgi:phosphatidylserine/phosphatidylglycerophosphate/cardiolipin synthase-like enzyme
MDLPTPERLRPVEPACEDRASDGRARPPGARLLRPGETCWRVEQALRAALIVDSEDYFAALHEAMGRARHSIRIIGWDFDPRIRLRPGLPEGEGGETVEEHLLRLIEREPALKVQVLFWDMALPIAAQHPMLPMRVRDWLTPDRLVYRGDSRHAAAGTHHQKIVVIDDALAFVGGIDLAADRWDTVRHLDGDRRRTTPEGNPFEPHHDVMMAVDGAAARALGELWRERWRLATDEELDAAPPGLDPWPPGLRPDIERVPVAVSRTQPALPGLEEVREIERLHVEAILRARRTVYIENQYFACTPVGEALARRLSEPDGPEVVVVCPLRSPNYFDHAVMDPTRDRLIRYLRRRDRFGRFRALTPMTRGGAPIVVHSKVTIVDDRLLRVGSANLNNRSMGFDTECDLAIEATGPGAEDLSRRILDFRHRLLAEHLDVEPSRVAAEVEARGGLAAAVDALMRPRGRSLCPLPAPAPGPVGRFLADLDLTDPYRSLTGHVRRGEGTRALAVGAAAALIVAGAVWISSRRNRPGPDA